MTEIFTWQNSVLLLASVVNLFMSILVASRGLKNKINLYFSCLNFFNGLWAFSLFLSKILVSNSIAEFFYRTAYSAAIGIALSLFYFCFHFPYKHQYLTNFYKFIVTFFTFFLATLVYTRWHIVSFSRSQNLVNWHVVYNNVFYIIYSLFFFILVVNAIYFLINKLKSLDSILYKNIKYLIITIIVGLFFGSYFNLILCYFGNWNYIWFGPIFTLFMNILVFYFIISPKEKIHA